MKVSNVAGPKSSAKSETEHFVALGVQKMNRNARVLTLAVVALTGAILPPGFSTGAVFTVTDLGTLGGVSSNANAINNWGQVVGGAKTESDETHAFVWNADSGMEDLGTLPTYGKPYSEAFDINDSGQVAGTVRFHTRDPRHNACKWEDGAIERLGDLGCPWPYVPGSAARGINNVGDIVGATSIRDTLGDHAFIHSAGVMKDLGTLGGSSQSSLARAINDIGEIVGVSKYYPYHAFRYSGDSMLDLGTLGGNSSDAFDINNIGQVVGESSTAFVWDETDGMRSIGTLGGNSSRAYAINDVGQIVGTARTADNSRRAFLHALGMMFDLNALIPADSAWTLTEAMDINNCGQIVGHGINPAGEEHAFLLTPGPRDPSLVFRESSIRIPGWDHCGLNFGDNVYESHPGYYGGDYWDPRVGRYVAVEGINGVQQVHTLGSFVHNSTTTTTEAESIEVSIDPLLGAQMVAAIEGKMDAPFLEFDKLWEYWEYLLPSKQKGADGRFTCVGLIEWAAEEAGRGWGQGFIPNGMETRGLTPSLLYWAAGNAAAFFSSSNWLHGLFDPVDFVLTDPLGRRLGYTGELGLLNEIPGAFYTGDGSLEEFLILDPLPGEYTVDLFGLEQDMFAMVGDTTNTATLTDFLESGESRELVVSVPVPEPPTLFLLAVGALSLLACAWRWRKRAA